MTKLLESLREDGHELLVHSQYHVQIPTAKGKHNLWFTSNGGIKFLPAGQRRWHWTTPVKLKGELRHHSHARTDLGLMEAIAVMQAVPITEGIYADAGFKDGKGRLAVIRLHDGDVDLHVRRITCGVSQEAEDAAIKLAMELFPGDIPIFNDCLPAVQANKPRARWLRRRFNKADAFGNMRGNEPPTDTNGVPLEELPQSEA